MVFYAVVCPVHLFCLGISAVFDTVCLVRDGVSLVNCTEKVIIPKPQPLVILFCLTTLVNTMVVLSVLHLKPPGIEFCGFRAALNMLAKKGTFWSLNITFAFVIVDYIMITSRHLSAINTILCVIWVLFLASRLIVAYFINYVPRVKYPQDNERNCATLYTWSAYWLTLVMFFLDTAHVAMTVTLDVAEKVTPLGNVKEGSHDFQVVAHLVLLGIKATFELRLFLFYWNKLFHGNKDLFSTFIVLKSIQAQPYRDIPSLDDESNDRSEQRI